MFDRTGWSFVGRRAVSTVSGWSVVLSVVLLACTLSWADDAPTDYVGPEYRIGPEDQLDISVWREEELQRTVLVRPDGGISFPLAGSMPAAGKTTRELEQEITAKLQAYIPEAVVTVSVSAVSGYRIYVLGEVRSPGDYVVGRYVDVLQVLALAGGLSPYASENKIRIVRRDGGEVIVLPFRFKDAEKGVDLGQNVMLQSGDIVIVP